MPAIRVFTGHVSHVREIPGDAGNAAALTARFTPHGSGGRAMAMSITRGGAPDLEALFEDFAEIRFIGDQDGPNSVTPLARLGVPLRDPVISGLARAFLRLRTGRSIRLQEPQPGSYDLREIFRIVSGPLSHSLTTGPTLTRSVEITYLEDQRVATGPEPVRITLDAFAAHVGLRMASQLDHDLDVETPEPWLANLMVLDQRQELSRRPVAGSAFRVPYRIFLVAGDKRSWLRTSVPPGYGVEDSFDAVALDDLLMQDLHFGASWSDALRTSPITEPMARPIL